MSEDRSSQHEIARALGEQLRTRREALGLRQDELGERVGLSRVQLQNIEAGWADRAKRSAGNPRMSTLISLCRELKGRVIIDVARPTELTVEFDPLPES